MAAQYDTQTYMATCIPGLASVLSEELTELRCQQVTPASTSAVWFQADLPTVLRVILWVRTAHKVLELLATAEDIRDKDGLYQWIQNTIPVTEVLQSNSNQQQQPSQWLTLSVQVIRNQVTQLPSDLTHSHFTALTIKNALVDQARELSSDRPSVSLEDPDVPLVAILHGSRGAAQVSLYRQLHTDSLHKRGYRSGDAIHKAAMKESLAAGLLRQAGFSSPSQFHQKTILDPMAGSGTLLIEAALMAANIAPGLVSIKCGGTMRPPVVRWHHTQDVMSLWKDMLREATQDAKTGLQVLRESQSCRFYGNELHPGALQLFQDSLYQAGLSDLVEIQQGNCNTYEITSSKGRAVIVVTNPPWGIRLDSDGEEEAWDDLRTFLRSQLPPGSEAWILSGNKNSTRQLKWKRTNMFPIQTGQQQLRWIQYKVLSDEDRIALLEDDSDDEKGYESRPRSSTQTFQREPQRTQQRDRQRASKSTSHSPRKPPKDSTDRKPQRKVVQSQNRASNSNEWLI
jgi:putative N6-adenine-specific DNA methylase